MTAVTYSDSGVHINGGDDFASFIRSIDSPAVKGYVTKNAQAGGPIAALSGGFAGGFELDTTGYTHPVVLHTTDGVGTKLLIAAELGRFDTVGIDLVAMCVNDLIVHGADPVSFLDYIACGTINRRILEPVIRGIVDGCEQAACTLSGGETAELPGMYEADAFDLAGFAVGVAEKSALLPKREAIVPGCKIVGLASNGVHSNGLSLARRAISPDDTVWYPKLLTPTKIYVKELRTLFETGEILAAAHITGGGLEGNISRVVPEGCKPVLSYDWPVPEVFAEIARRGPVETHEMRRVFNLGIGMALIVGEAGFGRTAETADGAGIELHEIGEIREA